MSSDHQMLRIRSALRRAEKKEGFVDTDEWYPTNRQHKLAAPTGSVLHISGDGELQVPANVLDTLGVTVRAGTQTDADDLHGTTADSAYTRIPDSSFDDGLFASNGTLAGVTGSRPVDDDVIAYEAPDASMGDLEIDVSRVLQPISDPTEVSSHPAIRQIFTSPYIGELADELLDTIVDERTSLVALAKLMDAFLGDDDLQLMPQVMARTIEQPEYPEPEPGEPLPKVVSDPEWYFALPELNVDADHSLEPEIAAALREKLQVAQQRVLEYVRSMTQVREGLTHAHRMRRTVLNWCREMNGEDYVKADLDGQNNFDNETLGDQPVKDLYRP